MQRAWRSPRRASFQQTHLPARSSLARADRFLRLVDKVRCGSFLARLGSVRGDRDALSVLAIAMRLHSTSTLQAAIINRAGFTLWANRDSNPKPMD